MSMQDLLAESANYLKNLETRRTALLEEVQRLDEELSVCLARHGKLVNSTAPVSKLPNELLSNIFCAFKGTWVATRSTSQIASEVVLSQVSSHWRNVAFTTPLLWNIVNVIVTPLSKSRNRELNKLNAYLTRSGDCPLNISMHIADPSALSQFIPVITTHATRWHHVSIGLPSLQQTNRDILLDCIHPLSTPALEHLSISIGASTPSDSPLTFYPESCPRILTQGAPALSFLRLGGMAFGHLLPPFSQVATLHIDALPKNILTQAQFQSTLAALPRIENLSISGLSIKLPRDPFNFPGPTLLPTLVSLRVRGRATSCQRLLSFMTLPNLESLTLQEMESFDAVELPAVKSLTLLSCWFDETEILNLVHTLPEVTSLTVDGDTPKLYGILKQVDPEVPNATVGGVSHITPGQPAWTKLQTFRQRELEMRDALEFCIMVLRRQASKLPLSTLALDRRSRTVLRSKHEYWEVVKDAVRVVNRDELPQWPPGLSYEDPDDEQFAYDE